MRFVVALLFLVRLAHADVGVVVSGDPNMQARVLDLAQRWFQDNKQTLVAAPLGDAAARLGDCFVIEDMSCAVKLVAEHSKASTIVFIRADMVATGSRDFALTAYWFAKGKEPVSEQRTCTGCDDNALAVAIDGLMREIGTKGTGGKGQLKVIGGTRDVIVRVDGTTLGATPVEHELAAGSHEVVFVIDDTPVEVRRVDVVAGGVVEVLAPHLAERDEATPARRSRTLPILLSVGGLAAATAGCVLMYYGSLRGPDEPYVYTNATEIGLPLAMVGAFSLGFGLSGTF